MQYDTFERGIQKELPNTALTKFYLPKSEGRVSKKNPSANPIFPNARYEECPDYDQLFTSF